MSTRRKSPPKGRSTAIAARWSSVKLWPVRDWPILTGSWKADRSPPRSRRPKSPLESISAQQRPRRPAWEQRRPRRFSPRARHAKLRGAFPYAYADGDDANGRHSMQTCFYSPEIISLRADIQGTCLRASGLKKSAPGARAPLSSVSDIPAEPLKCVRDRHWARVGRSRSTPSRRAGKIGPRGVASANAQTLVHHAAPLTPRPTLSIRSCRPNTVQTATHAEHTTKAGGLSEPRALSRRGRQIAPCHGVAAIDERPATPAA